LVDGQLCEAGGAQVFEQPRRVEPDLPGANATTQLDLQFLQRPGSPEQGAETRQGRHMLGLGMFELALDNLQGVGGYAGVKGTAPGQGGHGISP